MCHFGSHRSEREYEFTTETEEEPDDDVEFEETHEPAEDVEIVADGGDE